MPHGTLARKMRELEEDAGITLFNRHNKGLSLTDAGRRLAVVCQELDEQYSRFWNSTEALTHHTTVTFSGSDGMMGYWLPHTISGFHDKHPNITIEVRIQDVSSQPDVTHGKTDVYISYVPPTDNDAVQLWQDYMTVNLYASRSYVEKNGVPESFEELRHHRLCMLDSLSIKLSGNDEFQTLEALAQKGNVAWRTSSSLALAYAIQSGAGIGPMAAAVEHAAPELDVVKLPSTVFETSFPFYLVMHKDTKDNPAPRAVFDWFKSKIRTSFHPYRRDISPESL